VRARGQGLGASTHWFMDALIATLLPIAAAWSKGLPFVFFTAAMVAQLIVVSVFFPQTQRLTLEEMGGALERTG
jgi:SP family arabinose:H+ symporter-like MFS transporter